MIGGLGHLACAWACRLESLHHQISYEKIPPRIELPDRINQNRTGLLKIPVFCGFFDVHGADQAVDIAAAGTAAVVDSAAGTAVGVPRGDVGIPAAPGILARAAGRCCRNVR